MQTSERADLLLRVANLSPETFESTALALFRYQARYNELYARYLDLLGRRPEAVGRLLDIPFLPIAFFKTRAVQTGSWTPETAFSSSGTTGQIPSQHLVRNFEWYLQNTRRGFGHFYGDPDDWCILALLPSYIERGGSSLVAMADEFIRHSRHPESGFFLHDYQRLQSTLKRCLERGRRTLLLGVSYALLDFAEVFPMDLSSITIMETGGMKGRRREITRSELHQTLREAFQCETIHSEYGMTELFSQAYARGGERFTPAPSLRVVGTEANDPFCVVIPGKSGVLNMIDLANVDTCAFIATEDLGRVYADGTFEVIGRLDTAELRGCNLMIE